MSDVFNPGAAPVLEPSPRWVRVRFNGETIADSKAVMVFREPGRLLRYYFPRRDVRMDLLEPSDHGEASPQNGEGVFWHVRVGERTAENAALTYRNPPAGTPSLEEYLTFAWCRMDAWYEEDQEVFVHPRDPYKRIDVIPSSRQIRVALEGVELAETRRPHLLFETGLPTRYYIPGADVNLALLKKTETVTACPYKGEANYLGVRIGATLHPDLVWYYRFPTLACAPIAGLFCFFNEKLDIYEDGRLLERPASPWS